MAKKLLIITSEELNPQNLLSSTFELSQAQILSALMEVTILSVKAHDSFSAKLKQVFKKAVGFGSAEKTNTFKSLFCELKEMLFFLVFRKKISRKYIIEGITVYEGTGYFFISTPDFEKNLDVWINAGYNAFDLFCKENGVPDIIHAHGRFLNAGALALAIKKKNSTPYIYTEHSTYYQRGLAPMDSKPILQDIIKEASCFTTVSISLANAVGKFLNRDISAVKVVPNVIDGIFENSFIPFFYKKTAPFTFLTVASLEYKKGIDILLKAFKKAFSSSPQYILKIAGDGPLRNNLQELKDRLGLKESVYFLGIQSKYAVKELMDDAQVFVLPSRVETFGVVVIEAMARGCPVIVTRSGGPEHIVNNESGIIVDTDNEEQLADALKNMAANYTAYNSENIHSNTINKYGGKTFLANMTDLYSKALIGLN